MTTFRIDTTPQTSTSGGSGDFKLLPSGKYVMELTKAELVPNSFKKKKHEDDPDPMQVRLVWELKQLTSAQMQVLEDGDLEDDETLDIGTPVFQYMTPYYATIRDRETGNEAPTPWKSLIDTFIEQGIIKPGDDLEEMIGAVQLVTVNKEAKKAGPNVGKMGNKVAKVAPVQKRQPKPKAAPVAAAEDGEDLPF
jgi:hypothetical protein